MNKLLLAVLLLLLASCVKAVTNGTFPQDFLFGVGTSAYQTEGAWNEDGKGENIWDRWIHENASQIANGDNADISCNSYHKFRVDVLYAAYLLDSSHYQFSISWSRILPNGKDVNVRGILYYLNLINTIIEFGMIPVATLYHYDLPQPLQDIGGWQNPEMVDYFVRYARVAFQYFDKVGYWLTFNDPKSTCRRGYGDGTYPPGIHLDGTADYQCAYVLVKSHAAVYHMYKSEFPTQTARMSIAIDFNWSEPVNDTMDHAQAAERRNLFEFGLYANPIFKENWPEVVINRVGNRSDNEHLSKSRLPEFTQEEIDYIKGTFDFMAINMFTTNLVADIAEPAFGDSSYMKDMKVEISVDPNWQLSSSGLAIVPWGARKTLTWLKNTYDNPEIFITGNGVSDSDGDGISSPDSVRIDFYTQYLHAILEAMYEDDVKVFGYTAWEYLDSFEWTSGYSTPYGLFHVNRTSPNLDRFRKYSADVYYDIARTHRLPAIITPTNPTNPTTTSTPTTTTPTTTTDSASKITCPLLILVVTNFYYIFLR